MLEIIMYVILLVAKIFSILHLYAPTCRDLQGNQ